MIAEEHPTRRSPPPLCLLFVLLGLFLFAPADLRAHARTVSFSDWQATQDGWVVRVRLPVLELDRRFGPGRWDTEEARAFALDHFVVRAGDQPCGRVWTSGSVEEDEYVAAWTLHCPGPARALKLNAFFDTAPSHLHLARIRVDGAVLERVVTAADATVPLAGPAPRGWARSVVSGLAGFFSLPAHVLCLAGLVLLAVSRHALPGTVAAFVLGGAVSLVLLFLFPIRVAPRTLESLLGLAVLVTAVECFLRCSPPAQALRWRLALCAALLGAAALAAWGPLSVVPSAVLGMALVVASLQGLDRSGAGGSIPWVLGAGFGLVHGVGYLGALETTALGSPSGLGIAAVLGFNLGVAAGAILAAAVLVLCFNRLLPALGGTVQGGPLWAESLVASALTAAGTYGFVKPALGLY